MKLFNYIVFKIRYWYAKWYLIRHRKEVYADSPRLVTELVKAFNTSGLENSKLTLLDNGVKVNND